MSRLFEIELLIEELTFKDFLDGKVFKESHAKTLVSLLNKKISQFTNQYLNSPEYKEKLRKDHEAYLKSRQTAVDNRRARAEWCEKRIKVGDIIRVTGTVSNKIRKVLSIGNTNPAAPRSGTPFVRNCSIDLVTGREYCQTTTTYLSSITHIYNKETKTLEKISDLIKNSQQE